VSNSYWQKHIEKGFSSTDEEGKGLVGVRRPAKMPELKENIESKTVQGIHILLGNKETPLTDVWKIGSIKAGT